MPLVSFAMREASAEWSGFDVPIEVRNQNLLVTQRVFSSSTIDLEPGIYVFSTRLPDGRSASEAREIGAEPSVTVPLSFEALPGVSGGDRFTAAYEEPTFFAATDTRISLPAMMPLQRHHFLVAPVGGAAGDFGDGAERAVQITLYEAQAVWENLTVLPWPQHVEGPREVEGGMHPRLLRLRQEGFSDLHIILPVWGEDGCWMSWMKRADGRYLPEFTLKHRPAHLLLCYLQCGRFEQVDAMLGNPSLQAEKLLADKVKHPVAAMVGAYTLLRLGDLDRLHDWTRNLLTFFPENGDAAAIRAAHLALLGKHDEAIACLAQLDSRGLPIFHEGLTLSLNRLEQYARLGQEHFDPLIFPRALTTLKRLDRYRSALAYESFVLNFTGVDAAHPEAEVAPGRAAAAARERIVPPPPASEVLTLRKNLPRYALEYVWLDGTTPVPQLQSQNRLQAYDQAPQLAEIPRWNPRGFSINQMGDIQPDCVLQPVALFPDGGKKNGIIILCEVMWPDGSPHPTNTRATIPDDTGAWLSFEQEFFFFPGDTLPGSTAGLPPPNPSGNFAAGVGFGSVGPVARQIMDQHVELCLEAGLNHEGYEALEVPGQWKFLIFAKGSRRAADEMWIARYLLNRLCKSYGLIARYHSRLPSMEPDWNGSGMHSNFSTEYMRTAVGGREYFEALMAAFDKYKNESVAVYGPDGHLRLTGLHETPSIDKFNYGIAKRGASIRIPHNFVNHGYTGYLEDRRPNSQSDPYAIASRILRTIATVSRR